MLNATMNKSCQAFKRKKTFVIELKEHSIPGLSVCILLKSWDVILFRVVHRDPVRQLDSKFYTSFNEMFYLC